MALIWCDGFDHYGGSTARMLDGAWAFLRDAAINTTVKRTGASSLRLFWGRSARRIFGGPKPVVGVGFAMFTSSLPTGYSEIVALCDTYAYVNVALGMDSTGILYAYRADATPVLIGSSLTPVITANTFQHIEMRARASQTEGQVEVRVNGIPVINVSGVDTIPSNVLAEFSSVIFSQTGSSNYSYIDDVYAWDDTGDTCNDFLGDLRVLTLYPDADTTVADWTPTGQPTGAQCIDEASPNDDTDYIACTYGGEPVVSEFGLQGAPNTVGAIRAVQVVTRARKTDAGSAGMAMDLVSGAAATAATEQQLTDIYTYRQEVYPLDPATGTPWTRSSLANAKLRLTRTS